MNYQHQHNLSATFVPGTYIYGERSDVDQTESFLARNALSCLRLVLMLPALGMDDYYEPPAVPLVAPKPNRYGQIVKRNAF